MKGGTQQVDPLWVMDAYLVGLDEVAPYADIGQPNLDDFWSALSKFSIGEDSHPDAIFREEVDLSKQRAIAAALLRLLANDAPAIEERQRRIEVFKLFDRALEDTLYDREGLRADQQTFEKERTLRGIVPRVEEQVEAVVASLDGIETVRRCRKDFFKTVNSTTAQATVGPFLANRLTGAPLQEAFKAAEALRTAEASEVVRKYEEAKESVARFIGLAEVSPGWYVKRYLLTLGKALLAAVDDYFASTDAAKPASLSIVPDEKRYPLHEVGLQGDLRTHLQNNGRGAALDVRVHVVESVGFELLVTEFALGQLDPGMRLMQVPVKFDGSISDESAAEMLLSITWDNADNTVGEVDEVLVFEGQDQSVEWDRFTWNNPYDLEPVDNENDLVGRQEALLRLYGMAKTRSVGNAIIQGQKRVGKTSIAKTLIRRLRDDPDLDIVTVYIEAGEFVANSGRDTINQLCQRLIDRIRDQREELSGLTVDEPDGTLTPLNDFIHAALAKLPGMRVVLVIDEFDDIPLELYRRGDLASSFFLALRSISGKPEVGFVLVGGQNMGYVLSCQGQALNKFATIEVTYFDEHEQWDDFLDLVRKPAAGVLDFTDSALRSVFSESAGHPFFTKMICQAIFARAVDRRDSHVTGREVAAGIYSAMKGVGIQHFHHFWEDGIFEEGPKREEVSVLRRKVLLAIAHVMREKAVVPLGDIYAHGRQYRLVESQIDQEVKDFVHRRVLHPDPGNHAARLPLFGRWLRESGATELVTTFSDLEGIDRVQAEEARLRVSSGELQDLVEGWRIYRGKEITTEDVRAWLEQFTAAREQRLMFRLLSGIEFYSEPRIRQALRDAFRVAVQEAELADGSEASSREFIVSYLGPFGKSGANYARVFADESRVWIGNVMEASAIPAATESVEGPRVVVFLDDFLGTGKQAGEFFAQLGEDVRAVFESGRARGYFFPIVAMREGLERTRVRLEELGLPIVVKPCFPLGPESRAFHEKAGLFDTDLDRKDALAIAQSYGQALLPEAALGFGDCQTLVVFDQKCPNNAPAILWSDKRDWKPLFPRH
jgi:hypothetical protein